MCLYTRWALERKMWELGIPLGNISSVTVERGKESTDPPLYICVICLHFKYSTNVVQVVPISLLPPLLKNTQLNSGANKTNISSDF